MAECVHRNDLGKPGELPGDRGCGHDGFWVDAGYLRRRSFGDDQAEAARNAATLTKNGSRKAAQDEAIRLKNLTKANDVSDAAYAALAFPGGPTPENTAPTATVPSATVDTSERLRHTIHFRDAAAGGNKRRPRGVVGLELWRKVDRAPPGSEKDCVFVAWIPLRRTWPSIHRKTPGRWSII